MSDEPKKPNWVQRAATGVSIGAAVTAGTPDAQAEQAPPEQRQVDVAPPDAPSSVTLAQSRRLPPENAYGTLGAMGVGIGTWALWQTRRKRRDDDPDRKR